MMFVIVVDKKSLDITKDGNKLINIKNIDIKSINARNSIIESVLNLMCDELVEVLGSNRNVMSENVKEA